ncbi:hypothetical protein HY468_03985 [Candidatus Roizmanbacteria bacterium]|nr:hypothetical protein [Candidatus Roizmanbacteria bacterium]
MHQLLFHRRRPFELWGFKDKDIGHHLVLLVIMLVLAVVFLTVSYSRLMQFTIGVIAAGLYVGWGIVHHTLEGDLHVKNVIEYVSIALLGVVILGGILL